MTITIDRFSVPCMRIPNGTKCKIESQHTVVLKDKIAQYIDLSYYQSKLVQKLKPALFFLSRYFVSYIPGGTTGMKFFTKLFSSAVTKTVSSTLPV